MATTKNHTVPNVKSMTRSDLLRVACVADDSDLRALFEAIAENNGLEMGYATQRIALRLAKGDDAVEIVTNLNKFFSTVS